MTVIFLEPKLLYRTSIEEVPIDDYEIPLGQARIVQNGSDITLIGWGGQIRILQSTANVASEQYGISCEIIDLQTLVPLDLQTLVQSVQRTGKCIISHEAPLTSGYGGEIVSLLQTECFYSLTTPIRRITGYDTPFPLVHEKYYVPNQAKILHCIVEMMVEEGDNGNNKKIPYKIKK